MNNFINKKIESHQTVPEALRQARLSKGEDIFTISKKIDIQKKYLQALEDGAYENIPGEIYAKKWLDKYGGYLNLDSKWLIKEYQREKGLQMQFNGFDLPEVKSQKNWFSWLTPKTLKFTGVAIIVLTLLTFLGLEVKGILEAPSLTIYEPSNNMVTNEKTIELKGETDKEIILTINGEEILADQSGFFQKEIYISPGLNILEIIASKKHGQKNKKTINIYRQTNQVQQEKEDTFSRR